MGLNLKALFRSFFSPEGVNVKSCAKETAFLEDEEGIKEMTPIEKKSPC